MTSRAAAQARRKYELGYAAAYRDFYTRLKVIGELTLAEAISQPAGENTKKTEDSSPKLPSPFEQALFELYERIMIAYKLRLVESQLGAPLAVRRLANLAESTYQEIYQARIAEFAERAGSYGGRAFPEVYLALVPANARGHTSQLFRRLEEEILSKANAEDIVKMETDEPTPSAGPMGSVTSPGTRPSVVPVRYGRSPEGVFGESLYLENEESPAHAVQVEPLTIGEWTVTFSEISRIKDEASSRATISCGSSGVSTLDGPWLESWEAMGKPDGVPMHLVYRDFEGHSFRSICALERDVLNKDSGFSVRFVRQELVPAHDQLQEKFGGSAEDIGTRVSLVQQEKPIRHTADRENARVPEEKTNSGPISSDEWSRAKSVLTSVASWFSVQAQIIEEMNALPARVEHLIMEGRTFEEAQIETRLEGFDIQAGAYFNLISDLPTFRAYLVYLRVLCDGELAKVGRRVRQIPKPIGIDEGFWEYATKDPASAEKVYDPLGGEIVRFETGLIGRVQHWRGKAYRRAADLKLPTLKAIVAGKDDVMHAPVPGEPDEGEISGRQRLSQRDKRVHDLIGRQCFSTLTNAELMRDRAVKREMASGHGLKPGEDATKSCLDRIRKAMGYPLSKEIARKRSRQT